MKPKIVAILLAIPLLVYAQSIIIEKPLQCLPTDQVLRELTREYAEQIVWHGVGVDQELRRYGLWVNESSKTWTLVQFDETIACILGAGSTSTEVYYGPRI